MQAEVKAKKLDELVENKALVEMQSVDWN